MNGRFLFVIFLIINFVHFAQAQLGNRSGTPYLFPDLGTLPIFTGGAGGPLTIGYGLVRPDPGTITPTGFAVFRYRANGVLVTEAAVPSTTAVLSGRTYAEVNGAVNTGIAIANPSSNAVTISFYFTDAANGSDFGQGSFSLGAGTQIATFLNQAPFNAPDGFVGTFTFNASAPVGITSLLGFTNERGEFVMSGQTVAAVTGGLTSPVVIPQFADGGGWKTSVELVNTSDEPMVGSVQFFDEGSSGASAQPLRMMINGQAGTSFSYAIPARASVHLDSSGGSSSMQVGSVIITSATSSNSPSAQALLSFVSNGITVTQASVPGQSASNALRMYLEAFGPPFSPALAGSAVAITNARTTSTSVNIEVFDIKGVSTGLKSSLSIPGRGHVAKFMHELFPSLKGSVAGSIEGGFQGIARITSASGAIVVAALLTEYNERGDFLMSTTQVSDEAAAPSTGEAIFPHLAVMGAPLAPVGVVQDGYYMQFVLFNGGPTQSSSGGVGFHTQSGEPLNLIRVFP